MRADRLVATLLLMQARGKVTAREVADELEISVRTARRDLEALNLAGVPVYSRPGRGGGWSLVGGARTDLTGFRSDEARALLVIAAASGASSTDFDSALRKLVRALPGHIREEADRLTAGLLSDAAKWGSAGATRPDPPWQLAHFDDLQRALLDRRQVELGYEAPRRGPTRRIVHPLGLVVKATVWYFLADTDDGRRSFRVDRVTDVRITDDEARRPDEFDLRAAWDEIVADYRGSVPHRSVAAIVEPWVIEPLRALGLVVTLGDELADGRREATLESFSSEALAAAIAGVMDAVELVDAADIESRLAEIGAGLVERFGR